MRSPLKRTLREAWHEVIEHDYARRRVNSERSLQASMWAALNRRLPSSNRRLFVEPHFTITGRRSSLYPDLVVCNSRTVLAVIELKYQPKRSPSIQKDLGALQSLATATEPLVLSNERFLGEVCATRGYPLTDRTLFAWAGVYRAQNAQKPAPFEIPVPGALTNRFFSLHAITAYDRPAMVWCG